MTQAGTQASLGRRAALAGGLAALACPAGLDGTVVVRTSGGAFDTAFVDFFLTDTERHVAFAREMRYVTTNKGSLALLGPAEQHELVSSPAILAGLARIDGAWVDANRAVTLDRWNRWLAS